MNILIINHFAYGPDQSAGTRHYQIALELQRRGHQVLIVASSFYHKGRVEARLSHGEIHKRQSLGGVPFQWIRTPSYKSSPIRRLWNMVVFAYRANRAVWLREDDHPTVIVGSSPSLLSALAAYRLARRLGVPFVLDIRDLWPDSLRDIGNLSEWNPVFKVFRWIERFLYARSNAIITALPKSTEHIAVNGGKKDSIFWVPNGIRLENHPVLQAPISESPSQFFYFGAHGPYSGLETLAESAALLKERGWSPADLSFVLIGDPPKDYLVQRVGELNVEEFFEFRNAVPKDQLWEAIADADVFLMIARPVEAHKKGISPNKLWDYFAAGRPVLFSIYFGKQLADASGGGLAVPPGDAIALADGIERMWRLPQASRIAMGDRGRKYVEKTADMKNLAICVEEVLEGVLAKSASHSSNNRRSK